MHSKEFAGKQGRHQIFDPSILPYKFGLIFIRMKQKKEEKKIQNGRFFKMAVFQSILLTQGPICEIFANKFWKLAILKNGHFEKWPILNFLLQFFFFFFFSSFLWKSVQICTVEWLGQTFDVFPVFQQIPCYA